MDRSPFTQRASAVILLFQDANRRKTHSSRLSLPNVPGTGQLPPTGSVVDLRPTNTHDLSKSQVQFSEKRQVF